MYVVLLTEMFTHVSAFWVVMCYMLMYSDFIFTGLHEDSVLFALMEIMLLADDHSTF